MERIRAAPPSPLCPAQRSAWRDISPLPCGLPRPQEERKDMGQIDKLTAVDLSSLCYAKDKETHNHKR